MMSCTFLYLIYFITFASTSNISVIIVGAGSAGIAAATRLVENSITNVIILEAENRIGGRIDSVLFGEGIVEVGAEYCHGQKGNIVYELGNKFDLLESDLIPVLYNVYYSNGSKIDVSLVRELDKFFEQVYTSIEEDKSNINGRSMGDVFTERYYSTVVRKYEKERDKSKLLEEFLKLVAGYVSEIEGPFCWYDSSAEFDYETCEGDQNIVWKGVGYRTILEILMKKVPIEDQILLNRKVVKIEWNEAQAKVLTSDNSTYSADHVIFTPSVGVLKWEKNKMFEPNLPCPKHNSIESTGFDGVAKIIMHFTSKWWNEDDTKFSFLFSNEALYSADFPEGPKRNGRSWVTYLVYMTQPYANPKVWVGWMVGEMVPEVEKLKAAVLKRGIEYVLKKFLGSGYNVTDIDEIMVSKWCSNENFRGTYSFTKTGTYNKTLPHQKVLAEPLENIDGKPVVLFAGEATSPNHFSTVHGAIESGHREADRIINLYGKNS